MKNYCLVNLYNNAKCCNNTSFIVKDNNERSAMIKKMDYNNKYQNDKFLASKSAKEPTFSGKSNNVVEKSMKRTKELLKGIISERNYRDMVADLTDKNLWTDSFNYVGFTTKKNQLCNVRAGLFDSDIADINVHECSLDDFSDVFTKATAKLISDKPQDATLYKRLYLSLLEYINNHRVS